ncbi:MAG: hypothetical protein WA633_11325 [Stellaceae bacterium]
MGSYRSHLFALALGSLTLAGPAFAENVPKPVDTDETFLTGLPRIAVMAGQVVECSADADKPAKIDDAMELANQIAIHFGLRAAFNYAGTVGYGSGHAFDKANCTQSIDGWKAIQAKYLNK